MKLLFCTLAAYLSVAQAQEGPLMQAVMGRYNAVKQNLIETAEVMPEVNYNFHLTLPQRSFGEWIDHTVISINNNCSAIKGVVAPKPEHATSKAGLVKAMKDSFAICDSAFNGMTDQKALTEITIGEKKLYPVTPILAMLTGLNEHYGNLVGYLRSKGITPPSTARAQKK